MDSSDHSNEHPHSNPHSYSSACGHANPDPGIYFSGYTATACKRYTYTTPNCNTNFTDCILFVQREQLIRSNAAKFNQSGA